MIDRADTSNGYDLAPPLVPETGRSGQGYSPGVGTLFSAGIFTAPAPVVRVPVLNTQTLELRTPYSHRYVPDDS